MTGEYADRNNVRFISLTKLPNALLSTAKLVGSRDTALASPSSGRSFKALEDMIS
jgi:hypothetical protein